MTQVFRVKILCIKLYYMLTNKANLRCTSLTQQIKWGILIQCNVRATKYWICVNHEAAFSTGVQCRHFLDKNFKQITCLPYNEHVREMKVFSTTCSNTR